MARSLELKEEQSAFLHSVNWALNLFDYEVQLDDIDFEGGTMALTGANNDRVIKCRDIIKKMVASYYEKEQERRIY